MKKRILSSGYWPEGTEIPVVSHLHDVIEAKGVPIQSEEIIVRRLEDSDLPDVKDLEAEWFPFKYSDQFYTQIHDKQNILAFGSFWKPASNQGDIAKYSTEEILLGVIMVRYEANRTALNYVNKSTGVIQNLSCCASFCNYLWNMCSVNAYIMTIGVIDEARRLGVASMLINHVVATIKSTRKDCIALALHVIEKNMTAIKCYEKNQFVHVFDVPNYYDILGKHYNGKYYIRHIGPAIKINFQPEKAPLLTSK